MIPLKMVFSGKNFFFRHDRVCWSQWLRKLTVWKVTYSPPVFSFLLSLTERLLIAWLRINKNSWYAKTVSFGEEYERSKMITSGKIEHSAKCCFSILLKPSTSQTSELLHFLKNRVGRSISLVYTFGEFLAKSLKITHLNLLLITEKAS